MLLVWLENELSLKGIVYKEFFVFELLFNCIKVKFKKEIVIMGVEGIDFCYVVGIYVKL